MPLQMKRAPVWSISEANLEAKLQPEILTGLLIPQVSSTIHNQIPTAQISA